MWSFPKLLPQCALGSTQLYRMTMYAVDIRAPNTSGMNWNIDCSSGLFTRHQCLFSLTLLWLNVPQFPQWHSKTPCKAFHKNGDCYRSKGVHINGCDFGMGYSTTHMGVIVRSLHTFDYTEYVCIIGASMFHRYRNISFIISMLVWCVWSAASNFVWLVPRISFKWRFLAHGGSGRQRQLALSHHWRRRELSTEDFQPVHGSHWRHLLFWRCVMTVMYIYI